MTKTGTNISFLPLIFKSYDLRTTATQLSAANGLPIKIYQITTRSRFSSYRERKRVFTQRISQMSNANIAPSTANEQPYILRKRTGCIIFVEYVSNVYSKQKTVDNLYMFL